MILAALTMPDFSSPEVWMSLLTLTFLEVVLGIDNIIFITIASNRLDEKDQPLARNIGLILALVFRVIMLFGITYIITLQRPVFEFHYSNFEGAFTGQALILILGGIFLLYKGTAEIHHKLEGHNASNHSGSNLKKASASVIAVIAQIGIMDIVFSFDSVLTAIGLAKNILIMVIAVVIAILIMMFFAGPVSRFVNRNPTIQMLGLSFLILIGFMLVAEGAHHAHFEVAGAQIGTIPKGYLYFAIVFSLIVEFLNMRLRKKEKPIQLHGYPGEAVKEGLFKSEEN